MATRRLTRSRSSGKNGNGFVATSSSVSAGRDVMTPSPRSHQALLENMIDRILLGVEHDNDHLGADAPTLATTITKGGWCLKQGLLHIGSQDARLAKRIERHGPPSFYSCIHARNVQHCRHEATQDLKDPQTCFESLCRIVAGQFVSGKSAQAAWKRLLAVGKASNAVRASSNKDDNLSPETILQLVNNKEEESLESFQKAAGLTKAKARSIVDLAQNFVDGRLSEHFLCTEPNAETIRQALLRVRGIGPWSCDMFLLFYLERQDILPLGDLGVRKGIGKYYFPSSMSSSPSKQLCPKKDAKRIQQRLEKFAPYYSLLSYYMWRVADTPDEVQDKSSSTPRAETPSAPQKDPPLAETNSSSGLSNEKVPKPASSVASSSPAKSEREASIGSATPTAHVGGTKKRRITRRTVTP